MTETKVAQISRLILQNKTGMIKEQDIMNFFASTDEYQIALKDVVQKFREIGLSLVRTDFNQEKYFVLTIQGKDEKVSPIMYGILGILIGLQNDLGKPISKQDAQSIFRDNWKDIEMLNDLNYITFEGNKGAENIVLTPLGKASTHKIAKNIKIRDIINLDD